MNFSQQHQEKHFDAGTCWETWLFPGYLKASQCISEGLGASQTFNESFLLIQTC